MLLTEKLNGLIVRAYPIADHDELVGIVDKLTAGLMDVEDAVNEINCAGSLEIKVSRGLYSLVLSE